MVTHWTNYIFYNYIFLISKETLTVRKWKYFVGDPLMQSSEHSSLSTALVVEPNGTRFQSCDQFHCHRLNRVCTPIVRSLYPAGTLCTLTVRRRSAYLSRCHGAIAIGVRLAEIAYLFYVMYKVKTKSEYDQQVGSQHLWIRSIITLGVAIAGNYVQQWESAYFF